MSAAQPTITVRVRSAMAANRRALVVIPAVAGAVATAYYTLPPVTEALGAVGRLKAATGMGFAVVSTALFAGVLPWLVRLLCGRLPPGRRGREALFLIPLMAWRGVEVDLFYRAQGWAFDGLPGIWPVVVKTVVDQLTFTALWATPTSVLYFRWKDHGAQVFADGSWKQGFIADWISTLVANWLVWVPTLCAVYAMPADLQIPLFCLVACLWMLILSANLERGPATAPAPR